MPSHAIMMVHGSIESGRIWYSESGRGLAPYLAQQGYNVYVVDLAGRGQSKPKTRRGDGYSQRHAINQELPALIDFIKQHSQNAPMHWVAHSWGGVVLTAFLARYPRTDVLSMVMLGTKRRISVLHAERFVKVDLMWTLLGKVMIGLWGYWPARFLKAGSDNEPGAYHKELTRWVYSKKWRDKVDGFDYKRQLKQLQLPQTLHLTGINDTYLGHPKDVQLFMNEVANPGDTFRLLSKQQGNKVDYGHIDICTHKEAVNDHFPVIVEWLRGHQ